MVLPEKWGALWRTESAQTDAGLCVAHSPTLRKETATCVKWLVRHELYLITASLYLLLESPQRRSLSSKPLTALSVEEWASFFLFVWLLTRTSSLCFSETIINYLFGASLLMIVDEAFHSAPCFVRPLSHIGYLSVVLMQAWFTANY